MDENSPDKIIMNDEDIINQPEQAIITLALRGETILIKPSEAIGIINQLSGVLMAYECSRGYQQSKKKYLNGV